MTVSKQFRVKRRAPQRVNRCTSQQVAHRLTHRLEHGDIYRVINSIVRSCYIFGGGRGIAKTKERYCIVHPVHNILDTKPRKVVSQHPPCVPIERGRHSVVLNVWETSGARIETNQCISVDLGKEIHNPQGGGGVLEYLRAQLLVMRGSGNVGEKDEILVKQDLYHLSQSEDRQGIVTLFGQQASDGIEILDYRSGQKFRCIGDIAKEPSSCKADILIKMVKTGVVYASTMKSDRGAPPALINHTHRGAKVFREGGPLHKYLQSLDTLVGEYINNRKSGSTGEDIPLMSLVSMKNPTINTDFKKVLAYFVFEGTGSSQSSSKANSVLYYSKEGESEFTDCRSLETKLRYIDTIIDKCIVSLRNKGMPKKKNTFCKPWTYEHTTGATISYKGSLHIRLSK